MDIKKVLSIAGSDPSGGAGVQADLKTFTALGVYGAAVITSLTVQDTQEVSDALFLPGPFVKDQVAAVLGDIDISVIKTGMLGNSDIARSVGEALDDWSHRPAGGPKAVVCDPVMISKSGYPLLKEDAMQALLDFVLPAATVLTPNAHELEKLAALVGGPELSPVKSAETLMEKFDNLQAVLVKGGHLLENGATATDTLVMRHDGKSRTVAFSHPRIDTKNTHGTGCTLSSAIASYLALGNGIQEAVGKAVDFVQKLIAFSAENPVGRGYGPLIHFIGESQ